MQARSQEERNQDSSADKLAELKKRLIAAIDEYLAKAERKPVKVSVANAEGYRLHYMRGEEGKKRAVKYKAFITECADYEEMVKTVLQHLKCAAELQEQGVVAKATAFLATGYEYSRSVIAGYLGTASSDATPAENDEDEPTLGNSEALSLDLARVLCAHLDLNPRNEEVIQELSAVNPAAAKAYEASELKRIIAAVDKYLENNARSPSLRQ